MSKYESVSEMSGRGSEPDSATASAGAAGSEEERRWSVFLDLNRTSTDYPKDSSIQRLFEEAVEKSPDAVAVTFDEERITYRELNRRANRLAFYLRSLGAGLEVPVAILMQRSLNMITGLLGILKAGAAYLPLDPSYPSQRLKFMLEDARVEILLTEHRWGDVLPEHKAKVLFWETVSEALDSERDDNPPALAGPDNLAYVMYTSGSTGQPKGVGVTQRNVIRLVKETNYASLGEDEIILQFAPVSFDASTFEIWGALLNGAQLVLFPSQTPSLEELGSVIQRHGITTLWLTAGLFHQMVEGHLSSLRPLRQLLAGGDVLSVAHVQKALAELSDGLLINGYGPTENTTFTCCYGMTQATRIAHTVPIGKPIANTQVYLLDDNLEPVGAGQIGELYAGGDGLARGYLNRPELTAERFIPHPHGTRPGARLYKTGDLARLLPDGNIEFAGRVDEQVKVRGFRIELGEIEAALGQHPCVRQCVVIARPDPSGDKRLIAYLVQRDETAPQLNELRCFLGQTLPQHMLPAAFVILDEMPLTANGKVDRAALPLPEQVRPELDAPYVAPRGPVEELLAGIWSDVLGYTKIGVEDNFFELGGHSLKATQIVSRVRQSLAVDLPLHLFFEASTIAGVAELIERLRSRASGGRTLPLGPMPRDGHTPLSFSQERIWFLQRMAPESKAYHFQATLRFRGQLDREVLERALSEIVRRHEILRTTFPEVDGRPIQEIHHPTPLPLPFVDLQSLPVDERETSLREEINERMRELFDLTRLPLIKWTLFRLGPQEHVLLHIEHHLLHDGWSFNVFLRELLELYRAFAAGQPSPLPELPIQFADFAIWQRQWMCGEIAEAQLEFWRKKLAGSPPVLELPLDHPRPAVQSFRGKVPRHSLPLWLCAALRNLSRQEGVSLFMTMLAAFLTLLYRYTGQEDLCVGSGIANRRWRETEGLIGMVINNVVSRTDLSGAPTFRELLRRVRQTTLEAYAHQDLPFEKVVEALRPERGLSHNPIFQTIFSFHDSPLPKLELPGLEIELVEGISNGSAKFDLSVIVIPYSEQQVSHEEEHADRRITLLWEYSTDLFDDATMERMLAHYENLLAAVVADPERRLSELPLLSEDERTQLLYEWNRSAPAGDYVRGFVPDLIEAEAERSPSSVAVVDGQRETSYGELNARANQLAHYLLRLGAGPETPVGVCMRRSTEMLLAWLAVLKAGAAYVPIDPSYPSDRVAFMLEDTGMPVLLSHQPLAQSLPAGNSRSRLVCLDEDWPAIAAEARHNPARSLEPEHLAYIIYTSGSTGLPKGVEVTHRGLMNLLSWHRRAYDVTADDRATQVAGQAFDASVWEVWPYLSAGASLHIVDEETRSDVQKLIAWLAERRISLSFLPTPLAEVALQEDWPSEMSLRFLLTGGDKLHRRPHEPLPFRLINHYGPTENTVVSTCAEVASADDREGAPPIGRPIANTQAYVLDQFLQPVPIGVHGEIFLGGDSLARGYLRRPRLTAERFIPDPFGGSAGARLYRTGDVGRFLPDGQLEYVGRTDQQVKVRGYRIELGEIEATLDSHPAVQGCAVLAREDASDQKRLVAYVVSAQQTMLETEDLRAFLLARLPEYMVPSVFIQLEELPLTANGKIDRGALPAPSASTANQRAQRSKQALTPTEEILCGIWRAVLHLGEVGREDNFFELGGHSLLATQVISRVRRAFGVELPLRVLFERPTIESLAARIESDRQQAAAVPAPPLQPVARGGEIPLSFAQQRLWFLNKLSPGNHFYNISFAVALRGPLALDALERSLTELVRRHESLRTSFPEIEGRPVQNIAPPEALRVPVLDLSHVPEESREAELSKLLTKEAERPFDLLAGPLMRITLRRFTESDHVLQVTMHHIISDGWSVGVFCRELEALYGALSEGGSSPLPELPVQYADYAFWQREWLSGDLLQAEVSYWREQLAGAPPLLALPTDRPRPPVQTYRGAARPVFLPETLTASLKALCHSEGVTLYMLLLGAWQTLLFRYTGEQDISIGTPIAGRTHAEVEELIGFFVNTLVLRTKLEGDLSFRRLLARVREVVLEADAHQNLPFEKLIEELQPQRNLSYSPLFQVMLVLQNMPQHLLTLPGLQAEQLKMERATAQFDLLLSLNESEGRISGSLRYNTDLFDDATIERLVANFQALLESIATHPDERLSRLRLLTHGERQMLLREWNENSAEYPSGLCLHQLFEAQVERTPDAVAVIFGEERLTYRELNAWANRLACRLQSIGVGPERMVGICLERSTAMMAGLLAVLKAGGAYVPLDPTYPAERLSFMLEDTHACVLLTQRSLRDKLPSHAALVLLLDELGADDASESTSNPASAVLPENPAYVIYTSGSTGRPKGVVIEHRNATTLIYWSRDVFPPESLRGVLASTSISFDISIFELFFTLSLGGTVVLAENALQLAALPARQSVTLINTVPSAMKELLKMEAVPDRVRVINLAGEPLSSSLVQQIYRQCPQVAQVFNLYGPSEDTTYSTFARLGADSDEEPAIGRPISNTQCYLLDQHLEPVPLGATGEIYLGGEGLSRGYLNRPDLTAARFIPDPFSERAGARLYRTGDLARYLPDGQLKFLGRADYQVKIRGFRIELGEIEATLRTHPEIREAVLTVREEQPGEGQLVAYIVSRQQPGPSVKELRQHLARTLPEHMLPSIFISLETLPLTPNGKLDRRALPALERSRPAMTEKPLVLPRNPLEERLAQIWSEVLGLEQVGVEDDFFELGGHSLLATQVVWQTRKTFQLEIPLQTFFEASNIAGLALEVERLKALDSAAQRAGIRGVSREDRRAALSSLKRRQQQ